MSSPGVDHSPFLRNTDHRAGPSERSDFGDAPFSISFFRGRDCEWSNAADLVLTSRALTTLYWEVRGCPRRPLCKASARRRPATERSERAQLGAPTKQA